MTGISTSVDQEGGTAQPKSWNSIFVNINSITTLPPSRQPHPTGSPKSRRPDLLFLLPQKTRGRLPSFRKPPLAPRCRSFRQVSELPDLFLLPKPQIQAVEPEARRTSRALHAFVSPSRRVSGCSFRFPVRAPSRVTSASVLVFCCHIWRSDLVRILMLGPLPRPRP